ncbi:MAG: lytic transglycosylase domain-containing protein [Verrucomicrobiota bacterium]
MDFAFQREPAIKAIVLLVGTVTLATQLAMVSVRSAPARIEIRQEISDQKTSDPVGIPAPAEQTDFAPDRIAEWLVEAVVQVESGGSSRKIGDAGERGIMQIKCATWSHTTRRVFGHAVHFDRAFDPNLNRLIGRAYLAEMSAFLRHYRRAWRADERSLLLACYNAGPARVLQARFDLRRLPQSTQSYVQRATALHDYYLAEDTSRAKTLLVAENGAPDPAALGS